MEPCIQVPHCGGGLLHAKRLATGTRSQPFLFLLQNKCNDGFENDDDDDYIPLHAQIPTSKPTVELSTDSTSTTTADEPEVTSFDPNEVIIITSTPEILSDLKELAALEAVSILLGGLKSHKFLPPLLCSEKYYLSNFDALYYLLF